MLKREAIEGQVELRHDLRTGQLVSKAHRYETLLRMTMLKRYRRSL